MKLGNIKIGWVPLSNTLNNFTGFGFTFCCLDVDQGVNFRKVRELRFGFFVLFFIREGTSFLISLEGKLLPLGEYQGSGML